MTERADAARASARSLADLSVEYSTGDLTAEAWIGEFADSYVKMTQNRWPGDNPHLAALRALIEIERASRLVQGDVVFAARESGASWTDVGEAAKMSKQGAHERWASIEEEAPDQ